MTSRIHRLCTFFRFEITLPVYRACYGRDVRTSRAALQLVC